MAAHIEQALVGPAGRDQATPDGELVAVAHDLRQPIATIRALISSCRAAPQESEHVSWHLDRLEQEASLLAAMVCSLLTPDDTPEHGVCLGASLAEAVASAQIASGVRIALDDSCDAFLPVAPLVLRRTLLNILANATRAAGPGGGVAVTVSRCGGQATVSIEDDGPGFGGVAPDHFLGLRIVRHSMEIIGGAVRLGRSTRLGGAQVELVFPVAT